MIDIIFPIGPDREGLCLPEGTDILTMPHPQTLTDPVRSVEEAITHPVGSPRLEDIITSGLSHHGEKQSVEELTACIVISDSTMPVPYSGESGILWPVVEILIQKGLTMKNILVLVATGLHRDQTEAELNSMLDPRVFKAGICVKNHDCHNVDNLSNLGKTSRGSDILINSDYVNSDIKILTGLVESHFMAGVSGGRKSICPGLIGEQGTYIFHGALMLADEKACALLLEGNPCHEESLEMARTAGADFIVNVTLDGNFDLTPFHDSCHWQWSI